MKKFVVLLVLALAAVLGSGRSFSQDVLGFACVSIPGGTTCSDGKTPSLRGYSTATTSSYATVAGHNAASDGGGGDFIKLGAASSICNTYVSGTVSGTGTAGKRTITGLAAIPPFTFNINTLSVGELVTGSNSSLVQVQPGTEIASIDTIHSNITLTLPLTGTSTTTGVLMSNITFTGDNDGTLIIDSEPTGGTNPGPQCWQKTNYRGGPREWGAYGDGNTTSPHDDTTALQYWLGNPLPHIGDAGTYGILTGLTCNGTTIRGPSNAAKGALFTIQALSSSFSDTTSGAPSLAMIHAKDGCGLYGVVLDATLAGTGAANVLSVEGDRVTVAENSALSHGKPSNVICSTGFGAAGMQLLDSEFNQSDGINLDLRSGCGNLRIAGGIIEGAGKHPSGIDPTDGAAIVFTGNDITVANAIVEQSAGIGLKLDGASRVSVTGMAFDDNGGVLGGAGIVVKDSSTVSVSGNHFTGNGGTDSLAAQISFQGNNDRVSFAGNTYSPDTPIGDVTLRPSYTYDAVSGGSLTNSSLIETPMPQVKGVYTPAPGAAAMLPQLQVPQVPANYLNGFRLNNAGGAVVTMFRGQASDSGNTATIDLAQQCTLDLGSSGPGVGLDTGSSLITNTTYFYFVIASADGGNPNCIASMKQTPSFVGSGMAYAPYQTAVTGNVFSGDSNIYNVSSSAGIRIGTPLEGTLFNTPPTPPTVTNIGTVTVNLKGDIANSSGMFTITLPISSDTAKVRVGMIVSDSVNTGVSGCSAKNEIAGMGYPVQTITPFGGTVIFTLVGAPPSGSMTGDCINISGGIVLTMSNNANTTQAYPTPANLTFDTGLYRLAGALYTMTDPGSGLAVVVPFDQEGDTFYLKSPVNDINDTTLSTSQKSYALLHVPNGLKVEALGRCVGGSASAGGTTNIYLYSPLQTDMAPSAFTSAPGYVVNSTVANTPFRYRLYTDTSQHIDAHAAGSSTVLRCETDGWVFHRTQ